MNAHEMEHRTILQNIAQHAMLARGLTPEFSGAAQAELEHLRPAAFAGAPPRDLRRLLWCSIDNDDSLDLDQLTVAESLPQGQIKVLVAIADVDALVKRNDAIDTHAALNTTSVYTAAAVFPMLPEKLSTDLTSLNLNQDRPAVIIEITLAADGSLAGSDVYQAWVHNQAKLAYNSVAAWLDGHAPPPPALAAVPGLAENLRLQDAAAQRLGALRHQHGALSLETIETRPVFDGDRLSGLAVEQQNRAKDLISNLMVAANGVTARFLTQKQFPSIRRVVLAPKRWDRIVEIAAQYGTTLPAIPDSKALEDFFTRRQAADPLRFPDLSLTVIKLLGAGEYLAEVPGQPGPGHFGLAVADYAHSTAPNRRFTDLITQRLLKAALAGAPTPYTPAELSALAGHCNLQENAANKVERQVIKSAAALLLEDRVGESFDAITTGASPKGTWVRLLDVPVEGRLVEDFAGVDVGDRLRVTLTHVDVEQGFIDFKRANSTGHA